MISLKSVGRVVIDGIASRFYGSFCVETNSITFDIKAGAERWKKKVVKSFRARHDHEMKLQTTNIDW